MVREYLSSMTLGRLASLSIQSIPAIVIARKITSACVPGSFEFSMREQYRQTLNQLEAL